MDHQHVAIDAVWECRYDPTVLVEVVKLVPHETTAVDTFK
mgnify:CR=1 FL=1